ncbi:PREDICTED: aryl hydrocarbon receptor-like [Ceratotherium simum simum]|uniref:Aryl hydrocarbon receptor-like n=1 Tax=Ceratotherium simum simum TaxID=73337 RepID=A0ABM1CS91_CERSS|nr:PREDICTED: aryl hydrocarbon receptor-like [Ceratotherium simum simum]
MAVTEDGYVLYVSPTVQDYLGFHQSDVIYQSVFELIHKEDRAMFQSQLCWPSDTAPVGREEEQDTHSLRGEKFLSLSDTSTDSLQHQPLEDPSYLERSFVCRFRCLLDNSSGFLELNFHGHLKFLPGQNNRSEDGILVYPQLTLFATATPRQPVTILELQNKTFLFQTKHKLDFTPIACDSRGKVVLGYTESELCRRGSGYQFIHTADMMYCAEKHVRMMRTGESGLTVFRLLTKQAGWLWVQANARLVFRSGQPHCIVARQRALTNAEGEEHLHKRALQLPFTLTTGEAVLYESSPVGPLTHLPARRRTRARKGSPTGQGPAHWCSLLGTMIQDESMHLSHITPTRRDSPLERGVSHDRHEEKEEEEQGEDSSLLALIETLLEKDTEEQPDLCSTLQPLWRENLLRADLDSAGPQNCCLLPPSQGRGPHSMKEALFHDGGSVLLQEPLAIQGSRGADPGPATKQQWVQMGLQTQENYSWCHRVCITWALTWAEQQRPAALPAERPALATWLLLALEAGSGSDRKRKRRPVTARWDSEQGAWQGRVARGGCVEAAQWARGLCSPPARRPTRLTASAGRVCTCPSFAELLGGRERRTRSGPSSPPPSRAGCESRSPA